MSISYQEKYLKYKSKYFVLKNQYGGIMQAPPTKPEPEHSFLLTIKTIDKKEYPINVKKTDTIKKIKDIFETVSGIPSKDMNLIWNGGIQQDYQTLYDLGIVKEETIMCVIIVPFTLTIQTNKILKYDIRNVKKTDTIKKIKDKFQDLTGFSVNNIEFHYNGQLLNDPTTLGDIGIVSKDTIMCIIKMPPVLPPPPPKTLSGLPPPPKTLSGLPPPQIKLSRQTS